MSAKVDLDSNRIILHFVGSPANIITNEYQHWN